MKIFALTFSVLAAVLMPVGAFARDKDRDVQRQLAQIYADRRANGYYDAPRCEVVRPDCRVYVPRDCDRDYRREGRWVWVNR